MVCRNPASADSEAYFSTASPGAATELVGLAFARSYPHGSATAAMFLSRITPESAPSRQQTAPMDGLARVMMTSDVVNPEAVLAPSTPSNVSAALAAAAAGEIRMATMTTNQMGAQSIFVKGATPHLPANQFAGPSVYDGYHTAGEAKLPHGCRLSSQYASLEVERFRILYRFASDAEQAPSPELCDPHSNASTNRSVGCIFDRAAEIRNMGIFSELHDISMRHSYSIYRYM